jgi:DNA-binding CsgD family transcriptional regulator
MSRRADAASNEPPGDERSDAVREAIVALSDTALEAFGFGGLLSLVRDAGLRELELLEDDGYTCVPQVTVEQRLDPERLAALDCVDDWTLVSETGDACVYLLELTATELPEAVAEDHEALLGTCGTTVTDRGALVSLVGSQAAIRGMLRHFRAAGARPGLHRLGEYEGTASTLDALTARQREVLETAYELGFYEVPREASTEAVARELDLDPATVAEHLQRAERNLLSQQLAD